MRVRLGFLALIATVALGAASPGQACSQEAADRIAALSDDEWAQEILGLGNVAAVYTLVSVDLESDKFSFSLTRELRGRAPGAFTAEAVIVLGCLIGNMSWFMEPRSVGDVVLVLGSQADGTPFRPNLFYDPQSSEGALFLRQLSAAPAHE